MTKKTKEAIKTSAVIVLVIAAVLALWIYPLNQSGKIASRPDEPAKAYNPADFGLISDSLSLDTEDNIQISGHFGHAVLDSAASAKGTVFLLHGLFSDGSSQLAKAATLTADGFNVIVYDQRAYGQSGGEYRSGGYFESNDLQSIIARLYLEDRLVRPVIIWGEDHGGSAALRIWREENRIDYVVAENPVVTGRDWQKRVVAHDELSAPEFMLGLVWWWLKQKSGYEISAEESDISDHYGWAMLNKEGRFLTMACGSANTPNNEYIRELKDFGGNWLVVECADSSLFENNRDEVYTAVMNLLVKDTGLTEE
ncbi:MAG: alpha/beta hydrolase [FCB group bacterium]|nr:alpha/beta hydrolase [FCB group bacterium]